MLGVIIPVGGGFITGGEVAAVATEADGTRFTADDGAEPAATYS